MKNSLLLLAVVLILSGFVSNLGINWGLPNEDHIYTYNMDEMTFLIWLGNMNPYKFDFDPKVYSKTHLPIYYAGAVLKIGEVFGLYKIGTKEYYKQHPEEFKNIILLLRVFFGKIPIILLIIFSFMIGRLLIDDRFGILLAGVSGFLPTILVNSNYAVENILTTLFIAITFYCSLKYYQSERLKYAILAGIFTGLSISVKQTGVLGFIFILSMLIKKREKLGLINMIKHLFISGVVCMLAFSITSPYYMKFLLLKIFSPSSIEPDLHHGTTKIMIPLKFSLSYIFWNMFSILKINFIQLGGILFFLVPFGIYLNKEKIEFKIIPLFIIVFYLISSFNVWATDSRLIPVAYFLAILGTSGIYCLGKNSRKNIFKGLVGSLLVISLLVYAGIIEFRYLKRDNQQISSEWIRENIFSANNITIGLNASPFNAFPDIITKEWMHNKHPDSPYYPDNYNETFIIPSYELKKFSGQQILPERELLSDFKKMEWLESKSPDYIVVAFSAKYGFGKWPDYLKNSPKYKLIKHFPEYKVLGVSNLQIYSYDIYIYRRV